MLHRLALAAALALAALAMPAEAQTVQIVPDCAGKIDAAGTGGRMVVDQNGRLCLAPSTASAAATGGITPARVNAAASTNATSVKGSAGRLYSYHLCNASGAAKYVRFYNSAVAPTVGTTAVVIGPIVIGAGACVGHTSEIGLSFPAGIAYSITGANGDTDTTAVAVGDVSGFVGYQ